MKYSSAMRQYVGKRVEEMEKADIVVGIPALNNELTIANVIEMVSHGLRNHYADHRSVIIVSDGGSTDATRDVAQESHLRPWQEKVVGIYRGPPGKASALRMVLEAAHILNARACMVVDADLRGITNSWVKTLLGPILDDDFDFVAPICTRCTYEGTTTDNIVQSLCQGAFGKTIRQQIGGEFAFSRNLLGFYFRENVWEADLARFGGGARLTVQAILHDFNTCQAHLGRNVHGAIDLTGQMGPMFMDVASYRVAIKEHLIQMRVPMSSEQADRDQTPRSALNRFCRAGEQEAAPLIPPS